MKNGGRVLSFVLLLTGVFLYGLPLANVPYAGVELLHLAAGLALAIWMLGWLPRLFRGQTPVMRAGWLLLVAGAVSGIALLFTGAARPYFPLLYAHIGICALGFLVLVADFLRSRHILEHKAVVRFAVVLVGGLVFAGAAWWVREVPWQRAYVIKNPAMPPAQMDGEGDGPRGPFFPTSAQTEHGGKIPSKFFMESQSCQHCHADIYEQWLSSAHRFSSFNNQWYRKSIEYMQDVAGVAPSKWCAGCHDPALLFSGKFDTPIRERIDTPEAQAGLGCVMCHSITTVKSTMGQGDYVLEYPELHELATSENRVVRELHDFLIKVNPEPHRRVFMKPFMTQQTAEFCSACHKVHLDVPVNNYRWIRGFNDYDNWQASAVSGQGARSFYYPAKPQKCADCHMPQVPSRDLGHVDGKVHSHRFPAANTALPFVNQDAKQYEAVEKFLKDKIVTLDIFALSPAQPRSAGGETVSGEMMTTFAVGEEAEAAPKGRADGDVSPVTAPLGRVDAAVRRGDTVRLDVVARTRKVGHFFPGGTVDAFDVWIELVARDEKGQLLFWSGKVEDDGKGAVEKGAHTYRSVMVDAQGNWINKRNAWATRALVYVRLIPPGAADTVHYRLQIPETAGKEITVQARLHYRKFMWWNTQFAFAGERDPHDPKPGVTPHYDNGRWVFSGDTSKVSGKLKQIPSLPIVTLAQDEKKLRVIPRNSTPPEPKSMAAKEDWERWNDYGIGLLLQGDLRGAEAAFLKVTEADPRNPDGWVNIGRVRVQEGNLSGAGEVLARALTMRPDLARAHFFLARVLKGEGKYDEAAEHLRKVLAQYPRDRVARDDLGRTLFLQRRYTDAIREFEAVLAIDPEDLQAHYNLMLCYNGLGNQRRALEHQARYLRFKADESAQTITGPYRLKHPEDNNERQAVHEHVSVPLDKRNGKPVGYRAGAPAPGLHRANAGAKD
ncbi:MAG: tetratricopeptide repeat protein [Acidobacteria bacterium]|nr:tetratricopeptide repeat protein [Acidobacteriota bacterium]